VKRRMLPEDEDETEYENTEPLRRKAMKRRARVVLLLVTLLALAGSSQAGPGGCTNSPSLTPYAFEQIAVSSTALGFTSATFEPPGGSVPAMAVVKVETNAIRSRADGLNPTATVGLPWGASEAFTVCGQGTMRAVRFIRQSADATLSVEYYREAN